MPQRTLAASSRADRARLAERHPMRAHRRRQPAWAGRISTDNASPRRHDGGHRALAEPIRARAARDRGSALSGPCSRCARSFRMTAGSCSVAISRSRPPQCGHARTSIANARCIKAAQLQAREPLFAFVPSEPPASGGVKAVGSAATRPYATTRARQRARAANSPWQISRFVSGRGVIAARRSSNSSGSNTSSRVPSCHACFSSSAMRPSLRRRRRSCAKGGRRM